MGHAAGGARQPELRHPRRRGGRRLGAVAMGAAGHTTSRNSARPPAEFAKAVQGEIQVEPGYHAAGGYGGGLILQHAIEQAGSIDRLRSPTRSTRWTSPPCSAAPSSPPTQGARPADRPRDGAGAVAEEGGQDRQRGDLAESSEDRRHPVLRRCRERRSDVRRRASPAARGCG